MKNSEITFTGTTCHGFFTFVSDTVKKQENPWFNLGFNIVVPSLLLIKGDDWFGGILEGLPFETAKSIFVIALAFPLGYGIYDFVRRRAWNFFSILGIVGVLLTGGIGLLELPPVWVAVKEAGIPGALGLATLISTFTRYPLVRLFIYRPEIFQVHRIQSRLEERNNKAGFETLMRKTTYLLSASFFLSSILSYFLARWIVVSPAGTTEFNEELAKMNVLTFPVIMGPALIVTGFAIWLCFRGLKELTGLTLEEMIEDPKAREAAKES
ncbi:MAG: VC0807 family protein [Verrucomicrobiota bacterium]